MSLPVAAAREMARVDARAAEEFDIPSACLMETAGGRAAGAIWERFGRPGLRVLVVCGKGNNGGDGFVIARYLLNRGAQVRVMTLFPPEEAAGDPALFLNVLRKMEAPIEGVGPGEAGRLQAAAAESDLVVDAILGTGFTPPARGLVGEAIEALARVSTPIAAVDIPSGLDATTGQAEPPHLSARLTLTFAMLKRGHLLMPAAEHAGEVVLLDIGIPEACVLEEGIPLRLTEASDVAGLLPRRRRDAHKGDAGQLLIVAGSPGMMGAALMTALSALRAGAGRVTLAVPEPLAYAVEAGPAEVMCLGLPASAGGTLDPAGFDLILEKAAGMNALVVGPGISTHPRTVELVQQIIQHVERPLLLDADALNALSQDLTVLDGPRPDLLLTPHPGEMARLAGISTQEVQADRIAAALTFATRHQTPLALKGWGTIVATPEGEAWINPTGNAALATAGTGDVLSGIVGGLLAQGLASEAALVAGVYLHGLAGDLAAQRMGEAGVTATDLLPLIPLARKQVLDRAGEKGR
ncbi:MAG: NAD(P)H-hydrate dehydratase [Nitrospinota bacterium]